MSDMKGSSPDGDVLLEAEGIEKSFPGVRALDGVSLRVRAGRLVALLGENGAGKSTLMNILSGVFPPDAGTIRLDGREVRFANPQAAQAAGIGIVFQELSLIPYLSVAENVYLGREPRTAAGLIDQARLHADTTAVLRRLDLAVAPTALVAELRVGQQQLVEIARALSAHARVLILDEPTSSLSAHEVEVLITPYIERFQVKTPSLDELIVNLSGGNQQKVILAKWLATAPKILLLDEPTRGIDVNAKREIYAFIDELARAGLGLIVVSSELPEVLALADRVMVLCEGRKTAEFTRAEATPERILHAALSDRAAILAS